KRIGSPVLKPRQGSHLAVGSGRLMEKAPFPMADLERFLVSIVAGTPDRFHPAAVESPAQNRPAGGHDQNAARRQKQLLGVQGDLKTLKELGPGQQLAEIHVPEFDFVFGHATLLISFRRTMFRPSCPATRKRPR